MLEKTTTNKQLYFFLGILIAFALVAYLIKRNRRQQKKSKKEVVNEDYVRMKDSLLLKDDEYQVRI